MEPVQKHSVHTLVFRSLKRTHDTFICNQPLPPTSCDVSRKVLITTKNRDQYGPVLDMPMEKPVRSAASDAPKSENRLVLAERSGRESKLIHEGHPDRNVVQIGGEKVLVPKRAPEALKPDWHAPWKLFRVLSGHTGWVRCLAVDPTNEFFATGAADRMIKIWDLASGILKLTLTGHISAVRGVALSARNPYLFSCGEDKTVRCWDLEQNKVIRNYHGHMSAVYGLALHPTVDVLVTCGRDATARVWDMRSKVCIHTLTGHTNTVAAVCAQETEPQIVTGSHDSTVRLWDLVAGKTRACLTNHKKSVRGLALHPTQHAFLSASPDNIKQWQFPDGKFLHNFSGHNAIVNAITINEENVVVSGGDNGSLHFWDWKSGYNFQRMQTQTQPGSIDSDAGIFALCFDRSGSRLLTAEADKTVKVYKEDESATEETHPIRASAMKRAKY